MNQNRPQKDFETKLRRIFSAFQKADDETKAAMIALIDSFFADARDENLENCLIEIKELFANRKSITSTGS